jgi:hypothetical protein
MRLGFLCLLLPLLVAAAPASQPSGTVSIEAWEAPHQIEFDSKNPPGDLARISNEPALADCGPILAWHGADLQGRWNSYNATLILTQVEAVTFTGFSEIRMPHGVPQIIRDHEAGHDALNALEWKDSAQALADAAAAGIVRMKFIGLGKDDAARQADAWNQARAERDRRFQSVIDALLPRMDALSKRYDELTDHGRSRTVDSKHGVESAWRERNNLPITRPATQPGK